MHLTVLAAFSMAHVVQPLDALLCQSCYNYNGIVCVSNPNCEGEFCLYEQILRIDGVMSVRKACFSSGQYQFDDGALMTTLNQCVVRQTVLGQYFVLLCSFGDECNNQCITTAPLLPKPITGIVTCYNCVSFDGSDCQTDVCQGRFCVYERRIINNQLMIRKTCSDVGAVQLDDGTSVNVIGVCEIRNTATARYYVKICNDADLCNNYCNPEAVVEPQRQPSISCYHCESYGSDCYTGQCTAQYCIYERQRRLSTGTTYVKKSCTTLPFVEYPDNRASTALNTCETRTIGDVVYEVLVCNSGNNCNAACPIQKEHLVSCYNCEATNEIDCNTGSCQGKYCLFTRTQSSISSNVKKSCTNTDTLLYPDNTAYASFGQCEYRQINGVNYDYKLCNSSSMCNSACSLGPYASSTVAPPPLSASVSSYLLKPTILIIFYTAIFLESFIMCK